MSTGGNKENQSASELAMVTSLLNYYFLISVKGLLDHEKTIKMI